MCGGSLLGVLLKTTVPHLKGSLGGETAGGYAGAFRQVHGHHAEAVAGGRGEASDIAKLNGVAAHGYGGFFAAPVASVGAPLQAQGGIGRDLVHARHRGGDAGHLPGPDVAVGDVHRGGEGLYIHGERAVHLLPHPVGEREGEGGGTGSATDADVDAALALVMASKQWSKDSYLTDAKKIISWIGTNDINGGHVKPGNQWNDAFNPSYGTLANFELFKSVDASGPWSNVLSTTASDLKACH